MERATTGLADWTTPDGCTPDPGLVGIPLGTVLSEVAPMVGNGFPNSITDASVAGVEGTDEGIPAGCNGGTETVGATPNPGDVERGGAETADVAPIVGADCKGGTETVGVAEGKLVGAIATDWAGVIPGTGAGFGLPGWMRGG